MHCRIFNHSFHKNTKSSLNQTKSLTYGIFKKNMLESKIGYMKIKNKRREID